MSKFFLVMGTAHICIVLGMAIASVGQLPEMCGEPMGVLLPFSVAFTVIVPSVFFYLAGLNK